MSDQRFDQDLRSVLLEESPANVPDGLRRRVLAVTLDRPDGSRQPVPAWRDAVPLAISAFVALAVVVAITIWWIRPPSQPGFGGTPSSSASVEPSARPSTGDFPSPTTVALSSPSPSGPASPSITPAPSVSVTMCRASDLEGRILGWQGAAGSRIADVEITNRATGTCFVRGTPGLQLVDAGGRVLLDSVTAGASGKPHVTSTDPKLQMIAGGRLRTQVQTSNYCGPAASPPIDVAFTLPSGGGKFVTAPGPGVSSADAVPPCLGSAGGQITMNGWQK